MRHVPFRCPRCGKAMEVVETRERDGTIWRRRACPDRHAQTFTREVEDRAA